MGPPFFENCDFQVGIDTKFGGGGVNLAQKVKSRVFGLWVGIINVDPPCGRHNFSLLTSQIVGCKLDFEVLNFKIVTIFYENLSY